MFRSAALLAAAAALAACNSQPATGSGLIPGALNTNSPIAGETLSCPADYPDSQLVFDRDGSLDGRYAGADVSGYWTAPSPDLVEVELRAGAITVHDTVRRTATGWRGENTSCG